MVFKDIRLKQRDSEKDIKRRIEEDAVALLLKYGHGIVDLPFNIYEILKSFLTNSGRVYDYKRFCTELFFPEISKINREVKDRNIMFLVERIGAYQGANNWYQWAEKFLRESPCIRCQQSDALRPAHQLIDPTELFKKLYDVNEGRFPNEELQKSSVAMQGLAKLGMASSRLSITDLKERANSVAMSVSYTHLTLPTIYSV